MGKMLYIQDTPLFVGTSGYKYDDWKGTFYNERVTNYDMLNEYARHFNFLEITYTFYKMPILKTTESIAERIKGKTKVSIRINKIFMKGKYTADDLKEFKDAVAPLLKEDIGIAYLCDFSTKFSASKANFELMLKLKDDFNELPIFFELPSRTWYKERYLEDMRTHSLGLVVVDMPKTTGFAPYYPVTTNSNTYFRLYGRSNLWMIPEEKILNYSYKEEELQKVYEDIRKLSIVSNNVFVSFCNLENGRAAVNALYFADMAGKKDE
jgi:uncharacterized protein YecE (DUF72 family)